MPVPEPSRPTTVGPSTERGRTGLREGQAAEAKVVAATRRLRHQPLAHEGVGEDLRHTGADILERADPAPR